MEKSIVLKRASLKDTRKFFFWFNNSTSIKNKIKTKKKILFLNHLKWFRRSLSKKETFIWIICYRSERVGQIRLEKKNSRNLEVDIFIDDSYRKKGIAVCALKKAEQYFKNITLNSLVKRRNKASIILFKKAEYKILYCNQMLVKLIKKI